jgi:uncharacterized RmlC-like cupin family protein
MFAPITISHTEAQRRHLKRADYVPCVDAFIDCRIPGSMPKENYSMIGPGVTQNASQFINLQEPHGFNIGAAGMYPGVTNNLHLHFTSETFVVPSGSYTLRWGVRGDEGEALLEAGDLAVMPTWVFRGFTTKSTQFGLLMTVLGGDDTGGIIWSPEVLKRARATGLWLDKTNQVIDSQLTGSVPPEDNLLPLMSDDEIAKLKPWSVEQMRARIIKKNSLDFREATLDTAAGFHWKIAPAIGNGLSQYRHHQAALLEPQSFSVEWIEIESAQGSAPFSTAEKMVLINLSPKLEVVLNTGKDEIICTLGFEDMISIPANCARSFRCPAAAPRSQAVMVIAGDHVKHPAFDENITARALLKDVSLDAGGKLARASVLPPSMLA